MANIIETSVALHETFVYGWLFIGFFTVCVAGGLTYKALDDKHTRIIREQKLELKRMKDDN